MKQLLVFLGVLLPLLSWAQPGASTQELPTNRLVVIGDAQLELPADQVRVIVTLQYTDPTDARKAYESHKAAEQRLVKLLRTYQVDEKNIIYSLLRVQKTIDNVYPSGQRREEVVTFQQIIFKLNDMKRYPELQLGLIGGGFNRFDASFTTTKEEDSKNQALEKAIQVARDKAGVMAKAAGRTLGTVLSVRDTEESDPVLSRRFAVEQMRMNEKAAAGASNNGMYDGNLFEIPQKIVVPAQVKVTFELK